MSGAVPSIAPRTLYNWFRAYQAHGPIGLCPGFGTGRWRAQEHAYLRCELDKVSAQLIDHYGAPSFISWLYDHGGHPILAARIALLFALRHFAQSRTQEQAIATLLRLQDENALPPMASRRPPRLHARPQKHRPQTHPYKAPQLAPQISL